MYEAVSSPFSKPSPEGKEKPSFFKTVYGKIKHLGETLAGIEGEQKTELPTKQCEIFPQENVVITLAKELLDDVAGGKSREFFYAQSDPGNQLDEFVAIGWAQRIIQFYNKYGDRLFKKVLGDLAPQDADKMMQALNSADLKPELVSALESASTEQLAKTAYFLTPFTYLLGPHTVAEANDLENALLGSFQEAITAPSLPVREPLKKVFVGGKHVLEKQVVHDYDDADYQLPSELKVDLPEGATESEAFSFYQALEAGDSAGAMEILAERAREQGKSLDHMRLLEVVRELSEWLQKTKQDLLSPEAASTLPESAQRLDVYHAGYNRTRQIKSFSEILLKKMSGLLLAHAMKVAESPFQFPGQCSQRLTDTVRMAQNLYKDVTEKGVPVFKDFAEYLSENAKSGEFHVGRDTQTTTFVASNALRWGSMTTGERKEAIRHVDISRTLIANTPQALLKTFLEQEGVNQSMMGVDGGYAGSSPERVLFTLNPDLTFMQASDQIKLIETQSSTRRFNPNNDYAGVVAWMETLPKYTERAQRVEDSSAAEYGKYLVVTKRRSETERVLAWTVQHAVWRAMIPKGMTKAPETP
jgi:hypothetical protein